MREQDGPSMREAIALRPACAGDERILKSALAALHDFERTLSDTRLPGIETADAYYDVMMTHAALGGAVLIAEGAGAFAGFIACMIARDNNPHQSADSNIYGYISDLYVAPEWRGRGVAQALLEAAVAHLKRQGMTRIRLSLLAGNDAALAVYRRCGFEGYEVVLERRV